MTQGGHLLANDLSSMVNVVPDDVAIEIVTCR